MSAVGVGVIGAGVISEQYLAHLALYPDVSVVFVADIDLERAASQAAKHGVPASGTVEQLLADPAVEIVVNLTLPATHVEVGLAALQAGKHVWSEKPIALDLASGRALVAEAASRGLLVGIAPDTVLGAGIQAGVRAVRDGRIGRPLSALTIIQNPGPDLWHPNPDFLFQAGAGPVLDIGPYYATTLVHVFGPATRVRAVGRKAQERRAVRTGPRAGETFSVDRQTNVGAIVEFASGAFAVCLFSFDSPLRRAGFVEITGTEATVAFPDPNMFDGELAFTRAGESEPTVEPTPGEHLGRGLGVVDMARSIRSGARIVAGADVALHVLDILLAIDEAIETDATVELSTTVEAVPVLAAEWDPLEATTP